MLPGLCCKGRQCTKFYIRLHVPVLDLFNCTESSWSVISKSNIVYSGLIFQCDDFEFLQYFMLLLFVVGIPNRSSSWREETTQLYSLHRQEEEPTRTYLRYAADIPVNFFLNTIYSCYVQVLQSIWSNQLSSLSADVSIILTQLPPSPSQRPPPSPSWRPRRPPCCP